MRLSFLSRFGHRSRKSLDSMPDLGRQSSESNQAMGGTSEQFLTSVEFQSLLDTLDWLIPRLPRAERRVLEAHPDLLSDATEEQLSRVAMQLEWSGEKSTIHRDRLQILRDARHRGADIQAIRQAYVNAHGGLALDVPAWLEAVEVQLRPLRTSNHPDQAAPQLIAMLRPAIARAQDDPAVAPETLAHLQYWLWDALDDSRTSNTISEQEGISALHAAIHVYPRELYPLQYANIQNCLAIAYRRRIEGARRENLETAIKCSKDALGIYTIEMAPADYAMAQNNLGISYRLRIDGERRINIEESINSLQEALRVHTYAEFPQDYATDQLNLGASYAERISGDNGNNIEQAIHCFNESLRFYTRRTFPHEFASIQDNLSIAYRRRLEGSHRDNLEKSIHCSKAALEIVTLKANPDGFANAWNNLGLTYIERVAGNRRANIERAIYCLRQALRVHTLMTSPIEYASIQNNLGICFRLRIAGKWRNNLKNAISCFGEALRVRTLDAGPIEHRDSLLNRAYAEGDLGAWSNMAETCIQALTAEELLTSFTGSVAGQSAIFRGGRNAATLGAFALANCGRFGEATVLAERGRARAMATIQTIDDAETERIYNADRRARFINARENLRVAQNSLNEAIEIEIGNHANAVSQHSYTSDQTLDDAQRTIILMREAEYRKERAAFDELVAEIRAKDDPGDFMLPSLNEQTILHSAGNSGVLVYIIATRWGGKALAAFSTQSESGKVGQFACVSLPNLTEQLVEKLLVWVEGEGVGDAVESGHIVGRLLGGYGLAQEGSGFVHILHDWTGETLREKAASLHRASRNAGESATLELALKALLGNSKSPELGNISIDLLLSDEQRATLLTAKDGFDDLLMQLELQRCLNALSNTGLRALSELLKREGAREAMLLPCGALAAFPLLAAEVEPGTKLGDLMPMSIIPSARALVRRRGSADTVRFGSDRSGVYAIGDSQYLHQPLPWGETEALTIAKLARSIGMTTQARVQVKAHRTWLIDKLRTGLVVDVSCHGVFDVGSPLDSALLLAGRERLTLRDALNHSVDLRGLRLLILSACQTAVLDLRGARDEVLSLAAGMHQAGAEAVLAALWSVNDLATYLLMARFAQLWLPHMDSIPPAQALAEAQFWLRTRTWTNLRDWHTHEISALTTEERREAGSITFDAAQLMPDHLQTEHTIGELVALRRGRGSRYSISEVSSLLTERAVRHAGDGDCPFADPIYWAAFQITGR